MRRSVAAAGGGAAANEQQQQEEESHHHQAALTLFEDIRTCPWVPLIEKATRQSVGRICLSQSRRFRNSIAKYNRRKFDRMGFS